MVVGGLGVGGWLAWYFQHGDISRVVIQGLHWQLRFIHQFTSRFEIADAQMLAANPEKVKTMQLVHLLREIGGFFLYPAMAAVLILAAVCFRGAAAARYCRNLDLEGLMREQARVFRYTSAFVGRRLRLSDIGENEPRPADPALTAREWIKAWATARDGSFAERIARSELAAQLGAAWRGPGYAQPHVRCLLAAFALLGAGRRDEALAFLGDLSDALPKGEREIGEGPRGALVFPASVAAAGDRWLSDSDMTATVLETMGRHFFTTPGLMSALVEARCAGGVLAPAQFAFLKLVDRRLWYALHSLGFRAEGPNPTPHPNPRVEAIGARDHWAAECMTGRPLSKPSIDRALKAVRNVATGRPAAKGTVDKRA
nr:hypothetical protein [Methylocapsa sp. RX1]